jgi:hypothetical protein
MNTLEKVLKDKGIDKIEDLDNTPMPDGSPSERETFLQYKKVLSRKELTITDFKEFCESQVGIIEGKWANYEYEAKEKLIPYHTVYKTLLAVIASPAKSRESLEKQLNKLIK